MDVWVISDGTAGNEKPALALAQRLGEISRVLRLRTHAPWRWVSPRWLPGADAAFGDAFHQALRAPPALAVGCGRQAALATRRLRRHGSQVVQLLDPRIDPRHWDVVVAPAHDHVRGDNVLHTTGSLHAIDEDWLTKARHDWPDFAALPAPRTVLLLGGPTRTAPLSHPHWAQIRDTLAHWRQRDGGSLLISASRRTPAWLRAAIRTDLAGMSNLIWLDETDGPNPYPGLLGWADRLVVTADSVNLLSEACATGKPVYSLLPEHASGRLGQFHARMLDKGHLRPLTHTLDNAPPVPLRERDAIAEQVLHRLGHPRRL